MCSVPCSLEVSSVVLDLFIQAWPALPPNAFEGDAAQVDDFTFKLAESKIQELNAVSTAVRCTIFVVEEVS